MAMNVQGKTALITGAGSGINFTFAKVLLSRGCNVVIADLTLRPESEELVREYSGEGVKAVFVKTDVADWGELEQAFEVTIEEFGGVDIVVPGAGIYEPPWSNFWSPPGSAESKDDVKNSRYAIMDINLTHPIRLTQLAIAHFLERKKSGTVVHVSSIAGQTPFFPTPLYVASKHAMNGFVRSLGNLEKPPAHIPKIRVNCVAPARILTPLWTDHPEKLKMVGKAGNWTTPEAVAQVMLDLVEKEEYVGGSIVEVGKNVRLISTFNDAGPQGHGNGLTSIEGYDRDTWESMEKQMGETNGNGISNGNGSNNGNGTNGRNGNGV